MAVSGAKESGYFFLGVGSKIHPTERQFISERGAIGAKATLDKASAACGQDCTVSEE